MSPLLPVCERVHDSETAYLSQHVIRLVVLPPEHLKDFPIYKYEVPVTLTTDQYGTMHNETLALGGVPFPALGLNDVHRYLRRHR